MSNKISSMIQDRIWLKRELWHTNMSLSSKTPAFSTLCPSLHQACSITRVTQEDCLVTHILQPDAESRKLNCVCPSVLSHFIKKHKNTCACTHRHALWVFVKCIYSYIFQVCACVCVLWA